MKDFTENSHDHDRDAGCIYGVQSLMLLVYVYIISLNDLRSEILSGRLCVLVMHVENFLNLSTRKSVTLEIRESYIFGIRNSQSAR